MSEVNLKSSVVDRIADVIYWASNAIVFSLIVALSIFIYGYFYLDWTGDGPLILLGLVLLIPTVFSAGWALRYILTGKTVIMQPIPANKKSLLYRSLVIGIIWFSSVALYQNSWIRITDPIKGFSSDKYKMEEARKAGYDDQEIGSFLSMKAQREIFEIGFIPPIILILLFGIFIRSAKT